MEISGLWSKTKDSAAFHNVYSFVTIHLAVTEQALNVTMSDEMYNNLVDLNCRPGTRQSIQCPLSYK